MRRASVILLVLFVTLSAVYYCFWRWQADNILAQSKVALANMSTIRDGVTVKIEHQGMEIRGFPFSHELVLHEPMISGSYVTTDMAKLLEQLGADRGGENAMPPIDTNVMHRFTVKLGEAHIGIHYFTTHGEVSFYGPASGDTEVAANAIGWKFEKPVDGLRCDVDFATSSLPYFLTTIVKREAIAWTHVSPYLRAASCHLPAQKAVAADTGEWLMTNKDSELTFDNILLDDKIVRFHLYADFPGSEIADRYQRVIAGSDQILPVKQFDRVGAQALKLDATVTMDQPPVGMTADGKQLATSPIPPMFDVDIKTFHYRDKMAAADFAMTFKSSEPDAEHTDIALTYAGTYKFEPAFDVAAEESLRMVLADKAYREAIGFRLNASDKADTLANYISDVIPKMSGFGTMHLDIDMMSQMKGKPAQGAVKSAVNVKKLRFSSDPYSLGAAGSFSDAGTLPEGYASIDSQHYPKMIADAVEYNNRFQRVLTALDASRRSFIISPEMYDAVISFLKDLNLSTEPDTLNISITADGKGGITISKQPYMMVMLSAMQKLGPLFAEPIETDSSGGGLPGGAMIDDEPVDEAPDGEPPAAR